MNDITFAAFVKNEQESLAHMLSSVENYVREIIIVDTGSTDDTIAIAQKFTDKIYCIPFTNFGTIRTATARLATCPWVLMLDADETLASAEHLSTLVADENVEAYAIPRKRWLDLAMTKQTELDAYPDRQVRLFRNRPTHIFTRELHECFDGAAVTNTDLLQINHFHDVFKTPEKLIERSHLYAELAKIANVTTEGGHPL